MIFEGFWFKGRLIALLAFTLVWSSAHCMALCANQFPASGAGTELPCHQHHPDNRIPASCSYPQLAQADVPRPALVLIPSAGVTAMHGAFSTLITIPLPPVARALPMLDVTWPFDLVAPRFGVLRI